LVGGLGRGSWDEVGWGRRVRRGNGQGRLLDGIELSAYMYMQAYLEILDVLGQR